MKKEIVMVIVLALLAVPFAGCLGGNKSPSPTPEATKNTSIVLNSTNNCTRFAYRNICISKERRTVAQQ